jgi:hypothetical protein
MIFRRDHHVRGFLAGDKALFFTGAVCLLVFACCSTICFDFDLSYDHDTPGIMFQSHIFIDNASGRVAFIEFVKQPIIRLSINESNFLNRAPPYSSE